MDQIYFGVQASFNPKGCGSISYTICLHIVPLADVLTVDEGQHFM